MLYPISAGTYIQTDNILSMTGVTVTMVDASTHVVSAAQFADIVAVVNANHG